MSSSSSMKTPPPPPPPPPPPHLLLILILSLQILQSQCRFTIYTEQYEQSRTYDSVQATYGYQFENDTQYGANLVLPPLDDPFLCGRFDRRNRNMLMDEDGGSLSKNASRAILEARIPFYQSRNSEGGETQDHREIWPLAILVPKGGGCSIEEKAWSAMELNQELSTNYVHVQGYRDYIGAVVVYNGDDDVDEPGELEKLKRPKKKKKKRKKWRSDDVIDTDKIWIAIQLIRNWAGREITDFVEDLVVMNAATEEVMGDVGSGSGSSSSGNSPYIQRFPPEDGEGSVSTHPVRGWFLTSFFEARRYNETLPAATAAEERLPNDESDSPPDAPSDAPSVTSSRDVDGQSTSHQNPQTQQNENKENKNAAKDTSDGNNKKDKNEGASQRKWWENNNPPTHSSSHPRHQRSEPSDWIIILAKVLFSLLVLLPVIKIMFVWYLRGGRVRLVRRQRALTPQEQDEEQQDGRRSRRRRGTMWRLELVIPGRTARRTRGRGATAGNGGTIVSLGMIEIVAPDDGKLSVDQVLALPEVEFVCVADPTDEEEGGGLVLRNAGSCQHDDGDTATMKTDDDVHSEDITPLSDDDDGFQNEGENHHDTLTVKIDADAESNYMTAVSSQDHEAQSPDGPLPKISIESSVDSFQTCQTEADNKDDNADSNSTTNNSDTKNRIDEDNESIAAKSTTSDTPSGNMATQYNGSPVMSAMCSICIEEFQAGELVRVLPKCRHAFHTECIIPWLVDRKGCCPFCKTDVL